MIIDVIVPMCFDKLTKPKNSMMLLMMGGSVSIIVLLVSLGYANATTFPNENTYNVKINGIMDSNENIKSVLGNVELYNCNNTTHAVMT